MKALVGAFNQEKALVGAFSVIVQPVVEPMAHYTALVLSVGLHDVGNHEGGGAGHAVIAVHQDPASAPQTPVYKVFGLLDFWDDGFYAAVRQSDHQVFQLRLEIWPVITTLMIMLHLINHHVITYLIKFFSISCLTQTT